ncbi:hypothetical protein GQR58_029473 [Nymphon striatum]|nr:hypothetical protein GQR58_029473 [Nymphon striatum]
MLITCVKSNETTNTVEDLKFTGILQNDPGYVTAPPGFLVPKPKKKKCCVSGNPTDRKLCANFQLGTILFPVLMLFGLYSIVCSTGQVAGPILLAILHCLGQIFTPCVRPHPTIGLFIPPAHTYLSFHTVLGTHQFSQQGI